MLEEAGFWGEDGFQICKRETAGIILYFFRIDAKGYPFLVFRNNILGMSTLFNNPSSLSNLQNVFQIHKK
jgi:hypothetical protein